MKNRGYAKFGGGGGGVGDEKAALWEIWKWRINTFFSCKSTNQNQDIHQSENYKKICQTGKIKLDDKQVKPVKAL